MAAAASTSTLPDLVVAMRARTADEQLHDMCAKMDAAFEARQKADPTSTPFLVYLVRNGFEASLGGFDRLGCLYTSRDEAVAQLSDVCAAESDTPQAGHDYMDVHVADLRTDAAKICELLVDVDHHDIRELLRDAEARQKRDRTHTAADHMRDMCAKMDAAFEARQKADPTSTPFLAYVVRNGIDEDTGASDRKGGLYPTRELVIDAIGRCGVFLAETSGFTFDAECDYFDVHVVDLRTDADRICQLITETGASEIRELLRKVEERVQADAIAARVAKIAIE